MEYIKRPVQVSRAEKQVLTPKNEQKNTQEQFTNIYEYLDSLKDVLDTPEEVIETEKILFEGTSSAPSLNESIRNFKELDVYYRASREGKYLYGKKTIPVVSGNIYFSLIDTFCMANSNEIKGMCVTYIISDTKITVQHANQFAIIQASGSGINGNNSYSIIKVVGKK